MTEFSIPDNLEDRKRIASDPNTSEEVLLELFKEQDNRVILEALASNPNSPREILLQLCRISDSYPQFKLVDNPNITIEIFEELAKYCPEGVASYMLRKMTTVNLLRILSKRDNLSILTQVAGNDLTPPEILEKLARHDNITLRGALARNPSTLSDTLEYLYYNPHENDTDNGIMQLRLELSKNSNTSGSLLKELAKTSECIEFVYKHPNTPLDLLKRLDEIIKDRNNAVMPDTNHEYLWDLSRSSDIVTLRMLARNKSLTPDLAMELLRIEDIQVLGSLASNRNTPIEGLIALSEQNQKWVNAGLAQNPNTPPNILSKIYKNRKKMRSYISIILQHLAANPSTPIEVLEALTSEERIYIRQFVAMNPSSSETVLRAVASFNSECDTIIVNHLNCTTDILMELLSRSHDDPAFYKAILQNIDLPFLEYLKIIAEKYPSAVNNEKQIIPSEKYLLQIASSSELWLAKSAIVRMSNVNDLLRIRLTADEKLQGSIKEQIKLLSDSD